MRIGEWGMQNDGLRAKPESGSTCRVGPCHRWTRVTPALRLRLRSGRGIFALSGHPERQGERECSMRLISVFVLALAAVCASTQTVGAQPLGQPDRDEPGD